jgi:SulP family sulfate permease
VVQGLDFFAEVPSFADQLPSIRGVSNAAIILVIRDMHTISSTAIKWLERVVSDLKKGGNILMLADVDPKVIEVLKKTGTLELVGEENIFPATSHVLDSENAAWEAARVWLEKYKYLEQPA